MDGPLLLAAWPNAAGDIVSSFRIAKNEEDSPPPVTGAFALAPIAAGTLRNATHMRVITPSSRLEEVKHTDDVSVHILMHKLHLCTEWLFCS